MYECEMHVFVWENKSLTAAEEFWEDESRIAVGDEEYTYRQTLLKGCFRWGISLERQLLSGRIQASQFAEDEEVNCYLVGSRLHGNLLWKNELTVIYSDSRLRRKFLGESEVRLSSGWIPGFTTTCSG